MYAWSHYNDLRSLYSTTWIKGGVLGLVELVSLRLTNSNTHSNPLGFEWVGAAKATLRVAWPRLGPDRDPVGSRSGLAKVYSFTN